MFVSDLHGKILKEFTLEGHINVELSLTDLPTGVLFINVIHDSGTHSSIKILNSSN